MTLHLRINENIALLIPKSISNTPSLGPFIPRYPAKRTVNGRQFDNGKSPVIILSYGTPYFSDLDLLNIYSLAYW